MKGLVHYIKKKKRLNFIPKYFDVCIGEFDNGEFIMYVLFANFNCRNVHFHLL